MAGPVAYRALELFASTSSAVCHTRFLLTSNWIKVYSITKTIRALINMCPKQSGPQIRMDIEGRAFELLTGCSADEQADLLDAF